MIFKKSLLEKYLNLLLIFLFPTQLAIHFWPQFAFVFGIRIDYLSPALYLTDILFVLLFVNWLTAERELFLSDIKKSKVFIISLILLAAINILFSAGAVLSLFKWLKILEFTALAYYVNKRKDVFTIENVSFVLFISLIFFSLIGILQFIRGKTFLNAFYLLGERKFSIFTPGIALVNIFGKNYLRAYSTFPHPNAMAGYIGASLIFIMFNKIKELKNTPMFIGLIFIVAAFILNFSLSAIIGVAVCLIYYLLFRKSFFNNKTHHLFVILLILASIYFSVISSRLVFSNIHFNQSFLERLNLGVVSGKIISENFITGSGLNTFIIKESLLAPKISGVWLLQPVHNIFLLTLAETGILFFAFMYLILLKLFTFFTKSKNAWGILIIIYILTTGFFDHYWLTIQQNMLLVSLLLGLSLRNNLSNK